MRLWDTMDTTEMFCDNPDGPKKEIAEGHTRSVLSVYFSHDGQKIVTGNSDEMVRIWDSSTKQVLHTMEGHTDSVWAVEFSKDDKLVVSGSRDKDVRVWDAEKGELVCLLKGHFDPVWFVAFNHDGTRVASASKDKTVRVWDVTTGARGGGCDHRCAVGVSGRLACTHGP